MASLEGMAGVCRGSSAHAESSRPLTEAIATGPKVLSVAVLAVDFSLMHGHGGGVQALVARVAVEAALVPWRVDADGSLSIIDSLATAWTLGASAAAASSPTPRGVLGLVAHLALLVAESLPLVHAQGTSAASKAIALWSVLAAMALLAVQLQLVVGHSGAVQHLVTHATLEAELMVLGTGSHSLLRGVDGLAALGALGLLWWLERHGS